MGVVNNLLVQYGYIVLFIAPMLETLALPIPGELLMAYCGFLVYSGRLNMYLSISVAVLGVISGLTVAYFIGDTLGVSFLKRYGKYFGIKEKKIERVSGWFDKYGTKLLIISCFIPAVRHITGYFSGIVKIPYKKFALNGYIGAFLWVATFIYLGSIFGEKFKSIETYMSKYMVIIAIVLFIIGSLIYIIKSHRKIIINFLDNRIKWMINKLNSKAKIIVGLFFIICFAFLIFSIYIFKDNRIFNFERLNNISNNIIHVIFNNNFYYIMILLKGLSSIYLLSISTILLILYIIIKGENKFFDISFIVLSYFGGIVLQQILNYNMMISNIGNIPIIYRISDSYKDETGIIAITTYGVIMLFLLKYDLKKVIKKIIKIMTVIIFLFICISTIFLNIDSLSNIIFNFIIGASWFLVNIIIFYIEKRIKNITSRNGKYKT